MCRSFEHNLIKYIYFILIFIAGIFIVAVYSHNTEFLADDRNFVTPIRLKGYYQEKNSDEWIPFNSYDDINTASPQITIKTEADEEIPQGTEIMFYIYRTDIKVFINGEEFYKRKADDLAMWESFVSPGIEEGDVVTFMMRQPSKGDYSDSYRYMLNRLYYGTKYSLLKHQVKANLFPIFVCAVIFIVGISILVTEGVLAFLRVEDRKGYIACGLLLISGAVCTFINYEYITLIFNNPSMVNIIDLLSEAVICEFMMIYLKGYISTEKYIRTVDLMADIWPASVVFYFSFQDFGIMNNDVSQKIMLIIILLMFFVEITFFVKDYFRYKEESTKYVLMSGMMLLATTIVEIIHYYIANIFWIYVFQLGMLSFTFVQLGVLMNSTKENITRAAKARRLEAELVKNNIAIMLSQIQPHFLYNSLTSIGYLCEKEPKTARRLVNQFSDYLRVNMDSLKQNKPVPFTKELDHVKTYLELEKMRFDDELNIEYDIETTEFMIPALTVQPIVENAVKHGACQKEDGGTVKLSVKEGDSEYIITVEDDGVGFDISEKKNDGRTHVGIENVRKRLEAMCNGTLIIESEKGKGTVAIIKIPKERTRQKNEDNSSR